MNRGTSDFFRADKIFSARKIRLVTLLFVSVAGIFRILLVSGVVGPMSHQKQIDFSEPPEPPAIVPVGNAPAEDRPRLRGQNKQIMDRLLKGPATNAELAEISLKYTSRISDIRKYVRRYFFGHDVVCVKGSNGINTYKIQIKE